MNPTRAQLSEDLGVVDSSFKIAVVDYYLGSEGDHRRGNPLVLHDFPLVDGLGVVFAYP